MGIERKWVYALLVLLTTLAILGITCSNFIVKSGTAGIGMMVILVLNIKKGKLIKNTWMVAGAFLCSILGDWFLSNMDGNQQMFIKGIALYFIAHLGYLAFALANGKIKWGFTGIVLLGYLTFFFMILYPAFRDTHLMVASLLYLFISCFSLGASVGIKGNNIFKWGYVFGVILILFSDTIISFKEFLHYDQFNLLITPTYYMAHISIIFSLVNQYGVRREITEEDLHRKDFV